MAGANENKYQHEQRQQQRAKDLLFHNFHGMPTVAAESNCNSR
jgi:hypothetical protein